MPSELFSIANGAANNTVKPALSVAPASIGAIKTAQEGPAPPKVTAPKPNDVHFDAQELQRNLEDTVHMLNQQIQSTKRGLGFSVDQALNGPVVTVRSLETGEVVRQIPNETVVRIAHNIENIKGLLLNAKV